jgi:multidrug efflux pump subunit AcrA (membrane-fusion protein)
MSGKSVLKLVVGLIVIFAIVGALTVVFNQRQNEVTSSTASIESEQYPVGIDYGGTVTGKYVTQGERVAKGQRLFVLQSPSLQSDLAKGLVNPKTISYSVTRAGIITLTAAVAGTVTNIKTQTGSFVQAGQVLATIDRAGSLFVSAQYLLTAREYARIADGARVSILLPNQVAIPGRVGTAEVQTAGGEAKSTLRVVSDGLVDGEYNDLVTTGTPVQATLSLRDDGVLAGVSDGWNAFMQKIGL